MSDEANAASVDIEAELTSAAADAGVTIGGGESQPSAAPAQQATIADATGQAPAAPVEQPPAQQPPAQPTAGQVAQYLRNSFGADIGNVDDAAAIRLLYQNAARAQQLEQQAEQLRRFYDERVPHETAFQQWLQSQQPKQPEPEQPKFFWDKPEYDQSWARYRTVDPETGAPKWREDTPAGVREKYENYHQARLNFTNRLVDDPEGVLKPYVEHQIQSHVQRAIEQYHQQNQSAAVAQQLASPQGKYAAYLYEVDPATGQVRYDPVTRQPIQSQTYGQMEAYVSRFVQAGIKDPNHAMALAQAMVERDYYAYVAQVNQRDAYLRGQVPGQAPVLPPQQSTIAGNVPSHRPAAQIRDTLPANMTIEQSLLEGLKDIGEGLFSTRT